MLFRTWGPVLTLWVGSSGPFGWQWFHEFTISFHKVFGSGRVLKQYLRKHDCMAVRFSVMESASSATLNHQYSVLQQLLHPKPDP